MVFNPHTKPFPMPMVVAAFHSAKTNKEGKHVDFRALTYGHTFLTCPLFMLAYTLATRLFMGRGEPMPESVAYISSWYVSNAYLYTISI